jgi:hypothetical protein
VDLRTSALLGTPSVQSVDDYYPFALEDGGRLVPITGKLVDRLAIWVAFRRFNGMSAANFRSLRSNGYDRRRKNPSLKLLTVPSRSRHPSSEISAAPHDASRHLA